MSILKRNRFFPGMEYLPGKVLCDAAGATALTYDPNDFAPATVDPTVLPNPSNSGGEVLGGSSGDGTTVHAPFPLTGGSVIVDSGNWAYPVEAQDPDVSAPHWYQELVPPMGPIGPFDTYYGNQ